MGIDVEVFLAIIRPLPIVPVEYAGELSMLHSNAMEMLETVNNNVYYKILGPLSMLIE